jgi:hypothetical protein
MIGGFSSVGVLYKDKPPDDWWIWQKATSVHKLRWESQTRTPWGADLQHAWETQSKQPYWKRKYRAGGHRHMRLSSAIRQMESTFNAETAFKCEAEKARL